MFSLLMYLFNLYVVSICESVFADARGCDSKYLL